MLFRINKKVVAGAAIAGLLFVGGGVAIASVPNPDPCATAVPTSGSVSNRQNFNYMKCRLDRLENKVDNLPETVTSTATVTQTVTATPSGTSSTTSSSSTSSTTTAPTTTTSTTTVPTTTTTTSPTPSNGLNCAVKPSDCGYPDETNTGVQPGVTLTPSGSLTVRTDGAVVENLLINGRLNIEAKNVTVRNVKVTTTALEEWAVIVRENGSATFENVEVYGKDKGKGHVQYAILSFADDPVVIDKANLHHCADCVQGEHITLTNSYIHDLSNPPGSHVDGFQCNGVCGVTIRHNTIFLEYTQTGTISLFADFGTPRNSVVEENLLAGGGYTIYGGNRNATGIKIINNRFSKKYYPRCGYWGTLTEWNSGGAGNVYSGNVWDETGLPVS